MKYKAGSLFLIGLVLSFAGCQKAGNYSKVSEFAMSPGGALSMVAYAAPGHFIAEHDTLEIITQEAQLQKSWESVVQFCGTMRCEVISSSVTTRVGGAGPSGEIAMRVDPADLNKLLEHVASLGKIAQHSTRRDDRTDDVIDAEAKIKNLTSFRDNLRTMMAKPSANVANLIEVQKQLTDTQAELDSEKQRRKVLADETEKIEVQISFRVESPPTVNNVGLTQIHRTLRNSGEVLADSVSSLISTVVFLLPWMVVLLPVFWFLAKVRRRWKLRRAATATS
jgi:uncharacterized protein DUF4349